MGVLRVIGGGGMLCPRDASHAFSQELGRFIEACAVAQTSFAALSVGGDGLPIHDITPESRRKLAEQAAPLYVRNPQDLSACQQANIEAKLCHDVVWSTSLILPRKLRVESRQTPRIGINLYPDPKLDKQLSEAFKTWLSAYPHVEFCFIDSHFRPPEQFNAFRPPVDGANVKIRSVADVEQGIDAVLDLDLNLVISDRLHFGMTAMSYGVPTLGFASREKARLAFEHVGLGELCWATERLKQLPVTFERTFLAEAKQRLDKLLDAGIREQAAQLFEVLT